MSLGGGCCSPLGASGGGGGGAVDSVFGRTGVVVAVAGDYDSDQIDNASAVSGATVSDALDALAGLGIAGKLAPLLTDANSTLSLTAGSVFILPAGTLTAARVYTIDRNGLPTTTPASGSFIYFICLDTTAHQKTVFDGASATNIWVIPGGHVIQTYLNRDDGTNWTDAGMLLIQT